MDITPYLKVAWTIIAAIVTYIIVPYFRAKTTKEQQDKIHAFVKMAVQAAEMLYAETGMGKTKKEYVIKRLNEAGYVLDGDELDLLIESAVLELKKNLE